MFRKYCDKCGKEIITFEDDLKTFRLMDDARVVKIAEKCRYTVGGLQKILGIKDSENFDGSFKKGLETKYIDLCDDCYIALNQIVGDFMDGTPVSAST